MKLFGYLKAPVVLLAALVLAGCPNDADVASRNISQKADSFQVMRRIVFLNTWTGNYELEVVGLCSIGNDNTANDFTITCKTKDGFKKHFLGRSANMTYFAEQVDSIDVSTEFYKVTFKPSVIIPAVDLR